MNLVALLLACVEPDLLVTSAAFVSLEGEEDGDYAGWAAEGVGDINGDGADDLLVGAFQANKLIPVADSETSTSTITPFHLDDETDEKIGSGVAYLFYGPLVSQSSLTDADAILMGDAASDTIGRSLSGRGDFNGDGLGDIAIGGMHLDFEGHDSGGILLLLDVPQGTSSIMESAFTIEGDVATGHFGAALDAAGDVDGDGLDDLLVAAHLVNEEGTTGRVTLLSGVQLSDAPPASSRSVADLSPIHWTAEAEGDYFGRAVAGAGDVNGDGLADLVMAAPLSRTLGLYGGAVYVVLGPAKIAGPITTAAAATWRGEAGYSLGSWISGAGDLDGDGYADISVGAYKDSTVDRDVGSLFVMSGGNQLPQSLDEAASQLVGGESEDRFGFRSDGVGDLDGDGFDDLVVGAPTSHNRAGMAAVYFGSADGVSEVPELLWTGESEGDLFGFPAYAGDLNGDGVPDLLLSAPGFKNARGTSYLLSGASL